MKTLLSFFILLFSSTLAMASVVPETMILRGSGEVRYLGFIKVYDALLYTDENVTRTTLLDGSSSRCLELVYDVDLTVENFIEAAETVLSDQHDQATLDAIQTEIDLLHANYQEVRDGDNYTLCYDGRSQQTQLTLNGELLVSVPSAAFAEIYFGIWLNETEPLSESLLRKLLAGFQE
ncbi:MAG: hypothetical protein D6B25_17535 [Desulfobulbaceae bacterium]|nr:MAG: hypothetical protein D6B25_17535 [Desulfobulbaceae bacterium]